ncbi:MAG: 8-oxo-dGTP diphosphatase MutT [Porticoccaceae bacterium]
MKVVHVAAAVILGTDGSILIARRPDHIHKGGLWEFPGGKVEDGETVSDALARELDEELAIQVLAAEPLLEVRHDYPDKSVLLDVWCVSEYRGEPRGNEGQPTRWVMPTQLIDFPFPEANQPIIDAVISRFSE